MTRPARFTLVMAVGVALASAGAALAQGAPGGPREVGVMAVARDQVPVTVTLPGRAVAYEQAAITPKVGGEVTEVAYEPGTEVTAGTVLFRLEDETLAAELDANLAAVESAEVAIQSAQSTVDRYQRLEGSAVSRVDLENAQVALASARANLIGAEAQRNLTELALERTVIRSPIDGVVDIAQVSVGDIVSAGPQTELTTVTQLDPIHVDVAESRARILRNLARVDEGTLQRVTGPTAELILETGRVYEHGGYPVSGGLQVSPTTGTVPARFRFANPDRLILPGQFVRVDLQIGMVDGVLVPQRATSRSADGTLTAFIVRDGRADEIGLTEAGTSRNAWIVTEGIAEGDLLILDGLDNLRDGAEVVHVPVTIDDEGVVRDVEVAGAAQPGPPETDRAAAPAAAEPAPAQPARTPSEAPATEPPAAPDRPTQLATDGPTPAAVIVARPPVRTN